jgi:L-aminoadipate-semialdehyde dehydrogenase
MIGHKLGHSRTGCSNVGDFYNRLVQGIIQLGQYPDSDEKMDMIPVDFVAKAIGISFTSFSEIIVFVSKLQNSLGKVFHIFGEGISSQKLFSLMCTHGYDLNKLKFVEWLNNLKVSIETDPGNALEPLVSYFANGFPYSISYDCSVIKIQI